MSVLSERWRSNWVSAPQLVFDSKFSDILKDNVADEDDELDAYKWSSIISNIPLLHEGSIIKFSLTIPNFQSPSCPDVSPWISYVSRNGVKSLTLLNNNFESPIRLPSYLFSRVRLENLFLNEFIIGHSPCFTGLRNLLSLKLFYVEFEAGVFREFITCCPRLQTLTFAYCRIADDLIINMPNLNDLTIDGMLPSISFKNASSLLSFSLCLERGDSVKGAVDVIKFLANSCKLQRLFLNGETCEDLADSGISRILPTAFKQLKVLMLSWIRIDKVDVFLCVFGMIRSCLNMEELKISVKVPFHFEKVNILDDHETEKTELDHFFYDPDYTFNHLCTIFIRDIRGLAVELKLISYLLAFSPFLKRLSFTCHCKVEADTKLQLHRKILKFRKASPKAKVVHDKFGQMA